jgi:site-specific recombinase XerD
MIPLAPLLESFFTERLMKQRQATSNTIDAYRYAFTLLLRFAETRTGKAPSDLFLEDVDATLIGAFLDHLETERGNQASTRNARLAAIHSFFRSIAPQVPDRAELVQRVLAIPQKRTDRDIVDFLTPDEMKALLAAPDQSTWIGRRDHCLLLFAVQTGLRLSEITGLRVAQLNLEAGAHVRCRGKGRKERTTPLTGQTVKALKRWLKERGGSGEDVVFPSRRGGPLSSDAVQRLVAKYAARAEEKSPSLREKKVTPHVLRHTTAVELLQAGVDRTVIALWLGHESIATTQIYLDADLAMKEAAMARLAPVRGTQKRFRADDRLMSFLKDLGLCRVG